KDAELTGTEAGLVVYLKAGEGSGSQLADASGHGNNATLRHPFGGIAGAVAGRIDYPGQRDLYTFTLADAKRLYLDSLTNNGSLSWSIVGPSGTVVGPRNFTSSDSYDFGSGSPVFDLAAGTYTLVIDPPNETVGSYGFRLIDVGTATAITAGTAVSG